jgi:hypothetical protein
MPHIAVLNSSTVVLDADVSAMLTAFQEQWNNDLAPVWNIEGATFSFVPMGQAAPTGAWWLVFLDDSDQATALAYHDLTSQGLPLSKVFAKTIQADHSSLSVGASHELCEMAVDPWLCSAYQDAQGTFWAGEVCDPVEDDQYGYLIGATLVSDFVTPSWFAYKFSQGAVDLKTHASAAFQVLTGGYAQKYDPQSGWVQVTGLKAAMTAKAAAAPGSRRERRYRPTGAWLQSAPTDRAAVQT